MANERTQGIETGFRPGTLAPVRVADGTHNQQPTPRPGYTGEAAPSAAFQHRREWGWLDRWEAAKAIYEAMQIGQLRAPALIYERTGIVLGELLHALIPSLLMALGVVAASTVLGAAIGGALGALAFGAGAAPGAVLGGQLGFDLSVAVLTWLGLGFLVVSIGSGLGEMGAQAKLGAERAAESVLLEGTQRATAMSQAADYFAQATATMVFLILQGLVAWLMKNPSIAAARTAVGSARGTASAVSTGQAAAAADAAVADLVALLRESRLPKGFATWVEQHWKELVENPKLQPAQVAQRGTAAVEGSEAQTPSQMQRAAQAEEAAEARMQRKRICFEPNDLPTAKLPEFDRQLAGQQKGLNDMTVEQYLEARDAFKNGITSRDAAVARAARADYTKALTDEIASDLIDGGMAPKAAKLEAAKQAAAKMDTLAALHNPDLVAGGKDMISDFGDRSVNSRLGAQWKSRIGDLDAAAGQVPVSQRATTKMNAQLERC